MISIANEYSNSIPKQVMTR